MAASRPRSGTIPAPAEGDLVELLECYFDESGSHDGSPILCVGGYVFEREHCKALDLGWKQILDQYQLPFFHMTDCAHNTWPFECIEAQKAAIRLINDHVAGLEEIANFTLKIVSCYPGSDPCQYLPAAERVGERGGPEVPTPTRQGFGTRVIDGMVGQLKGKARFDWGAEGLICEIALQA
jgi:hypothetical protein